ncbi:WD40 repeat domain-containing protein [Nostoc sp.]
MLRTIDAHSDWVLSVAINRDGNTLVSSSDKYNN